MRAQLGMFTALAAMLASGGGMLGDSWVDDGTHYTDEEKKRKMADQRQRYEALLRTKGVKSFYYRELDIYIMARDQKNADRKYQNLINKRFPSLKNEKKSTGT